MTVAPILRCTHFFGTASKVYVHGATFFSPSKNKTMNFQDILDIFDVVKTKSPQYRIDITIDLGEKLPSVVQEITKYPKKNSSPRVKLSGPQRGGYYYLKVIEEDFDYSVTPIEKNYLIGDFVLSPYNERKTL